MKYLFCFRLICEHLLKVLGDWSQIGSLDLTNDFAPHTVEPSTTLARRLLNKMPQVYSLSLTFNYLVSLINSPITALLLTKQITSLSIRFCDHIPVEEDMARIASVFYKNLQFLHLGFDDNFQPDDLYRLLPILFSDRWKKLRNWDVRIVRWRALLQGFSDDFKQILENYIKDEISRRPVKSEYMEYRITNQELIVSF